MPTPTKVIKQMVDPNDSSVYIYPVTGIYSTFDNEGTPLDRLLDLKMPAPDSYGTSGQFLKTNGDGTVEWNPVHNLVMNHRGFSMTSSSITLTNLAEREYVYIGSNYARTQINLNFINTNEHYVIVKNTAASDTITVGFTANGSEDIIGAGAVEIESGKYCEFGIVKSSTVGTNGSYIITDRELESYEQQS